MAFSKNDPKINRDGRPKGALNKIGSDLRKDIVDFLVENFDLIQEDFQQIKSPRDRIRLYIELLQYGLPKLKTIEYVSEIDQLTDQQVEELFERLKEYIS